MRITCRPRSLLVLLALFALAPGRGADDGTSTERATRAHAQDRPRTDVTAEDPGVVGEPRDYATLDGNPVSGYLARPRHGSLPFPAVLLIHERWGLNDNVRAMARRFAASGFVALAVDLYEGETASRPGKARSLMRAAMDRPERLRRNLEQAYFYLDLMPATGRIGTVGRGFGGGWSLRTALMFPRELDAGVIYYGELVTDPKRLQSLQVPLLGIFGGDDPVVPPERVRAFEQALVELQKPHEIHVYERAGHAFASPSSEAYDRQTAARAWATTMAFLREHLTREQAGASSSE